MKRRPDGSVLNSQVIDNKKIGGSKMENEEENPGVSKRTDKKNYKINRLTIVLMVLIATVFTAIGGGVSYLSSTHRHEAAPQHFHPNPKKAKVTKKASKTTLKKTLKDTSKSTLDNTSKATSPSTPETPVTPSVVTPGVEAQPAQTQSTAQITTTTQESCAQTQTFTASFEGFNGTSTVSYEAALENAKAAKAQHQAQLEAIAQQKASEIRQQYPDAQINIKHYTP